PHYCEHSILQIFDYLLFRLGDGFAGCGDNLLGRKSEFLQQILDWRGRSESVHSDSDTGWSEVAGPAERRRHFHGDPRLHFRRQELLSISLILAFKQVP